MLYNALLAPSVGKKPPKCTFPLVFRHPAQGGPSYRHRQHAQKRSRVWFWRYPRGQTDRHYALTKAQSESVEAVQKRAIRIIHISTHGMPYSSMLFCANLSSLASPVIFSAISLILPHVSTVFSPHLDRRLSPQGLDPLKSFLKFILARSATAPSYNMTLIITSIKSNKPSFPITPYIQRLVSLAYFLF